MFKRQPSFKKVVIWLGVAATIPSALAVGYYIAVPFYMHFLFEGKRVDFAAGDTFGVLICTWIFAVLIMIPAMLGWWRVYRNLTRS